MYTKLVTPETSLNKHVIRNCEVNPNGGEVERRLVRELVRNTVTTSERQWQTSNIIERASSQFIIRRNQDVQDN